ncbi:MAG: MMPL family transporter [Solirubrobacterales bacterium]|nr:MMPL family transporter [Solirubrobacterales bacterium]
MKVSRAFERIVGLSVRRPLTVVSAVALIAVAAAILALSVLKPSAAADTLVDRGSPSYQAGERFQQNFGDDAILILVRGELTRLLLTADLARLVSLEGCVSGNIPRGAKVPGGPSGPCAAFAKSRFVQVVYGPGTFINEAARQIEAEFSRRQTASSQREVRAGTAARALAKAEGASVQEQDKIVAEAKALVQASFLRDSLQMALKYGIKSLPTISDPAFVSTVVFDPARGANVPKARFAYLFPNSNNALVQVRLRPGLSEEQRRKAIELIAEATRLPAFQLVNGGTYTVTGAPVLAAGLADSIASAIVVLLIGVVVVMALALLLVFRSRPRLLPLGVALAATGMLFGAMAIVGMSLTVGAVAVLPVLVGLGVDYAIQFQSRYDESVGDGHRPGRAAVLAASAGGPTIATAGLATMAGVLALLLSPVPMVRDFGLLLVVGIALAFACALTAGFGALVLWASAGKVLPRPLGRCLAAVAAAGRGARDICHSAASGAGSLLRHRPAAVFSWAKRIVAAAWRRALRISVARPGRTLAVAALLTVVGFGLDTQTKVVSDVQQLVPPSLGALRDVTQLQRSTGVFGEVDVTVEADDISDPRVIRWMSAYQSGLLKRYGYSAARGCGTAQLCPALSLPDLFRTTASTANRANVRALLDAVPAYFSQAVITPDRHVASMAFGVKLMALEQQQALFQEMRSRLTPPSGVRAQLSGIPVLAAEANAAVSSPWRRALTLAASLLAVALVLLIVYRRPGRALVPLVPIVAATGWSALVIFISRIPLNPMSVTLGALVIAIATEFSVLLVARYQQERSDGHGPELALARTYQSTGLAVLASGVTAIAGFAVLMLSDIRMLRDFGAVTVIDLVVTLIGVMLVLPAVLLLAERRGLLATAGDKRPKGRPRSLRPRLRDQSAR